ncbi:hypothetical protein [Caldalkalibacillus uzonensis]|uniref:hypothetical protein n=1 Tax=Caldalkalibacillus uzonensis TaxID=353224 RepID=UPI0027D7BBA0|nr:hypothetical protein [Caldalkalibacillus uzonensis]
MVYSLGKVINFIFTGNPNNERHDFGPIVNKATSENRENRYESAIEMLQDIETLIQIIQKDNFKEIVKNDLRNGKLTPEVLQYINSLNGEELCKEIVINSVFKDILVEYMKISEKNEKYVIEEVEKNFKHTCPTFESYDPIASFAYVVLKNNNFSFLTKEKAAKILSYIAYSVNRFSSQRMIDRLIRNGVEPLIEKILQR